MSTRGWVTQAAISLAILLSSLLGFYLTLTWFIVKVLIAACLGVLVGLYKTAGGINKKARW